MLTRRDLAVSVITLSATLCAFAAIDAARPPIGESVYDWNSLQVKKTPIGETRAVLRGPTATLDELEIHVTTLNPGESSHPPHKHPNEELIILDKGTVETLVNGEWKRLGAGSVIFNATNVLHGLRNVGDGTAQYHVINWKTEKTPKE